MLLPPLQNEIDPFSTKEITLSDFGKKIRLNRILRGPGKGSLVVAFDHAFVLGPIPGTRDAAARIRSFLDAKVDGLLLNLGLMRACSNSFRPGDSAGFIARIDWTSIWNALAEGGNGQLQSRMLAMPEQALRQGADAVLTYLVVGTGDTEFEAREIARNAKVARECERVGIPFFVETLARGRAIKNPTEVKWLELHTRMAVELGADVIKTDYSGDPITMRSVVEACPIPILVLGGSRDSSDESALNLVRGAMKASAAGVFFGRNVFQADDMVGFLKRARTVLDGREAVAPID
jgi:DhnA family fructose-bisphosphate aldolase class Ia